MTTEQTLADYAARLSYGQTSAAARAAAKRLLLDALACMLAGLRSRDCRRLVALSASEQGAEQASVAGLSRRLPAATAARLNAALGHWYEWDDVHDPAALHTGMVIWPAVLATAEAMQAKGAPPPADEVLAAAIAAYDVAATFGNALIGRIGTGWMPTGIACTVAAAGAAARLRGLSSAGVFSAMAIAAAGVGLSRQPLDDRVSGKNVLCALAVGRAMEAADLAAAGISGAPHFIDGPFGVAALVGKGNGEAVAIAEPIEPGHGVLATSVKPFPSCRVTHPVVDLALGIYAEAKGAPAVQSVAVKVPRPMAEMCGKPFAPLGEKRVAAQFSIPYTVAVALRRGRLSLADFDEDDVGADAQVLDLSSRVRVDSYTLDKGQPILGSPVDLMVTFADGSVRTASEARVKGSPAKPMSDSETAAKLSACAEHALTAQQSAAMQETIAALESRGVAELMTILRQADGGELSS